MRTVTLSDGRRVRALVQPDGRRLVCLVDLAHAVGAKDGAALLAAHFAAQRDGDGAVVA